MNTLSQNHLNHQHNNITTVIIKISPGLTRGLIEKVRGHSSPLLTPPGIGFLIIAICVADTVIIVFVIIVIMIIVMIIAIVIIMITILLPGISASKFSI